MNANQIASKDAKKSFKNASKKNESNASKKEIASPASPASPSKINLEKFAKQLESVNVKEKKERSHIYIYPEGKGKEWINSEEGKKWRNNKRGILKRFSGNILLYAKKSRMDDLQKEIASFQKFYKEFFRINDYSLSSISNSRDESKSMEFDLMLDIVKSSI